MHRKFPDKILKYCGVAIFVVIVLVAGLLRFYKLGEWSLWIDEAFTIHDAVNMDLGNRPINYLLVRFFLLNWGISEFAARLGPALAGILSIALGYGIFQRIFNRSTAIWGSVFMALSPWHIYWSQNSRHYSLVLLLGLISVWFFWTQFEKNKTHYIVLFLLSFALAMLTHPSIAFLYPALLLYLIGIRISDIRVPLGYQGSGFKLFTCIAILGLIAVSPKLISMLLNYKKIAGDGSPFHVIATTAYYVNPAFILTALASIASLIYVGDRRGYLLLSLTIVPFLILLGLSLFVRAGSLYIYYTLPFYLYPSAHGLLKLWESSAKRQRIVAAGVLGSLVALQLSGLFLYLSIQWGDRPRWKEAAMYTQEYFDDSVLLASTAAPVVEYYIERSKSNNLLQLNKVINLRKPENVMWLNGGNLKKILSENRHVYFIINEDMLSGDPSSRETLEWIRQNCNLRKEFKSWTGPKDRTVKVYFYPSNT